MIKSLYYVKQGDSPTLVKQASIKVKPSRYTEVYLEPSETDPHGWDVEKMLPSQLTLAGVEMDWTVNGNTFLGTATFQPEFVNGPIIFLMELTLSANVTRNIDETGAWSLTFDSGGWLKNLVEVSSGALVQRYTVAFRRYFYAFADALPVVTIRMAFKTFFDLPIKENMRFRTSLLAIPTFTRSLEPPARLPPPVVLAQDTGKLVLGGPVKFVMNSPQQDPLIRLPRQVPSAAVDYDLLDDVDEVKHLHPWRA